MIIEKLNFAKTPENLALNADYLLEINESDYERVFEHYKVTPEKCNELVKQVQEWYSNQPHLPPGALHDQIIFRQLITKNFDLDRTKSILEHLYTAKTKIPEFLMNKDPLLPNIDKYIRNGTWIVLPKKTKDLYRVSIFRTVDGSDLCMADLMKLFLMIADYRYFNDMVLGEQVVFYMKFHNIQNACQFTPSFIAKVMHIAMYCSSPKSKGIHFVNLRPYSETALKFFKSFMKPKVIERIHMYSTIEDVAEKLGKDVFPCDLGGTASHSSEIIDKWTQTLQSPDWREWFIQQDKAVTDESKREKPLQKDDTFGVDGCFKKLEVD